jgi:hypothetical protein
MKRMLAAPTGFIVLLGALAGCSAAPSPDHHIEAPSGCALYVGVMSGNDEIDARLVLCPSSDGYAGQIQYESPRSGWSIRNVHGRTDPMGELVLDETEFVEQHPGEEWMFCLVDHYRLKAGARGAVTGEYMSSACEDHAKIELQRTQ